MSSEVTEAEQQILIDGVSTNIEGIEEAEQRLTGTIEGILIPETGFAENASHDMLNSALTTDLSSRGSVHISTSAAGLSDHEPQQDTSLIERQTSSPFPMTSGRHIIAPVPYCHSPLHIDYHKPTFFALQLKEIMYVAQLAPSPLSLNVDGY